MKWLRFECAEALTGICLAALVAGAHAQQPAAQDAMLSAARETINAGIAAFKDGRYEAAVEDFRKAVQAEPGNETAHLYLATAYATQVVPNLLTPENRQYATSALAEFDVVLKLHPDEMTAMKQEAAIFRNMQQYDQAMEMERKIVADDPNDAEAFYVMGSMDWTEAYKNAVQTLANDGLTDDGMGNPRMTLPVCEKLRSENSSLVEDGISNLTRAIELKPDYSDAMQYLQLTYRRRADFACGDAVTRKADLQLADEWTRKAIEARKRSLARPQ